MYLPVQREPVQRSVVGLPTGNPSGTSRSAGSGAAAWQGVEPSGLGTWDDILSKIPIQNQESFLPVFGV